MTAFISTAASFIVGAVLGWYVKGRGWFGVSVDATNAKNVVQADVQKVETEIKTIAG